MSSLPSNSSNSLVLEQGRPAKPSLHAPFLRHDAARNRPAVSVEVTGLSFQKMERQRVPTCYPGRKFDNKCAEPMAYRKEVIPLLRETC
jgi:hypothetical protein